MSAFFALLEDALRTAPRPSREGAIVFHVGGRAPVHVHIELRTGASRLAPCEPDQAGDLEIFCDRVQLDALVEGRGLVHPLRVRGDTTLLDVLAAAVPRSASAWTTLLSR